MVLTKGLASGKLRSVCRLGGFFRTMQAGGKERADGSVERLPTGRELESWLLLAKQEAQERGWDLVYSRKRVGVYFPDESTSRGYIGIINEDGGVVFVLKLAKGERGLGGYTHVRFGMCNDQIEVMVSRTGFCNWCSPNDKKRVDLLNRLRLCYLTEPNLEFRREEAEVVNGSLRWRGRGNKWRRSRGLSVESRDRSVSPQPPLPVFDS